MKTILAFLCLFFVVATCDRQTLYERLYAPPSWELLNRAHPEQLHTFTVALPQQNLDVLERTYWAVSDPDNEEYGNFLKISQIEDIVRSDRKHIRAVSSWLTQNGATEIEHHADAIRVRTTAKVVETLFQTQMYNFKHTKTGRIVTKALGRHSIPRELSGSISMVVGISDFVPSRPVPKVGSPSDVDGLVIPLTIRSVYNIPATTVITTNSSQAPIEFQNYAAVTNSDMSLFWSQTNTPKQPAPKVVGPFSGVGIESTLDYQYITAIGQQAKNWYWTEADWLYDFGLAFFKNTQVPYVISMSWGWSEEDQCEIEPECNNLGINSVQYVQRVNTEFQKIGLRGVTILAASGDSGANGRTDEYCSANKLRPDYPAASPFLVSVGATELNPVTRTTTTAAPACSSTPCSLAGKEVAVSFARSNFASGGGFSNVAAQPSWQKQAVANYLKSGVALPPASYFNSSSRGYPDVAALGHNFLIIANGQPMPVGGTSASAPTFAGVIALLNDYRFKRNLSPIGPANPLLYKIGYSNPTAFNDITVGDNKCTEAGCNSNCKGYVCAKGWDPVTGWGSPNYAQMLKYITAMDDERELRKRK